MEEQDEEEEEEEEEQQRGGLSCSTLGTGSSLLQSQLIRDQEVVRRRASLPAGSVGNILDIDRLRQLPKLL